MTWTSRWVGYFADKVCTMDVSYKSMVILQIAWIDLMPTASLTQMLTRIPLIRCVDQTTKKGNP
jgi:hypothetical protein